MKKIFIVLLLLCCTCTVYAVDKLFVKYNGTKYELKYSMRNPENKGFVNEYLKQGEDNSNWSEKIAVHHFPKVYSPIAQTEIFREYLNSMGCMSNVSMNEKKNYALIDFILVNKTKNPAVAEFNVLKFEKAPDAGTIAVQYTQRCTISNNLELELIINDLKNNNKKSVSKIEKFTIPKIVNKEINAIKLNDLP